MINLHLEKQGESITFFSEADCTAPRVENEVRLAAGAAGPPPHVHTRQSETFHVVAGRLILTIDGKDFALTAGESAVVQPGQVHTFRNGSSTEPVVARGTVEPALHFQWFLTEMSRAALRSGGAWKDLSILEAAYILHEVRDEYRLARIPAFLQDLIFGFLARLAVRLRRTGDVKPKDTVVQTAKPRAPPL